MLLNKLMFKIIITLFNLFQCYYYKGLMKT